MSATYVTPNGERFKRGDARKADYPITHDTTGWYLDTRIQADWARHFSTEREALSAAWNAIEQEQALQAIIFYVETERSDQ